jgi:tetratricopeptide (TPR) repeat protein
MSTDSEQHIEEGNIHLATGDLEKAVECYHQATDSDPKSYEAWHAYSVGCMKLERYDEAIRAGKRAIELNPQEAMGYTSLSLIYARNEQIPEAEEMAGKARILSWGGKVTPDT